MPVSSSQYVGARCWSVAATLYRPTRAAAPRSRSPQPRRARRSQRQLSGGFISPQRVQVGDHVARMRLADTCRSGITVCGSTTAARGSSAPCSSGVFGSIPARYDAACDASSGGPTLPSASPTPRNAVTGAAADTAAAAACRAPGWRHRQRGDGVTAAPRRARRRTPAAHQRTTGSSTTSDASHTMAIAASPREPGGDHCVGDHGAGARTTRADDGACASEDQHAQSAANDARMPMTHGTPAGARAAARAGESRETVDATKCAAQTTTGATRARHVANATHQPTHRGKPCDAARAPRGSGDGVMPEEPRVVEGSRRDASSQPAARRASAYSAITSAATMHNAVRPRRTSTRSRRSSIFRRQRAARERIRRRTRAASSTIAAPTPA